MDQREIRTKIGHIRHLAFIGTSPVRPKGSEEATDADLFRNIMKIATIIVDELDAEYRERQEKAKAWESWQSKLGGP